MALGTFTPVSATRNEGTRNLRTVLWVGSGVLLMVAVVAVSFRRPIVLDEDTDEIMKPWADGIYPARAHFPPGYKFGDGNTFGSGKLISYAKWVSHMPVRVAMCIDVYRAITPSTPLLHNTQHAHRTTYTKNTTFVHCRVKPSNCTIKVC